MMILIDLGNSRVKMGWLHRATGTREAAPAAWDHVDAASQIGSWLNGLPSVPSQAIGVSVGDPNVARQIEDVLRGYRCDVRWQRARADALGLKNNYTQPEQLGADRWAAMIGLLARLPYDLNEDAPQRPLMLASFGTATTLDTVSPNGTFVGGAILPGSELMRESLARNTAQLPLAQAFSVPYPTDTHQAIVTGVAAAQAGAVLRQWLTGLEQYGVAPSLHVTGGGWPLVAAEVKRLIEQAARLHGLPRCQIHEHDRPVLDGLAALAMLPH